MSLWDRIVVTSPDGDTTYEEGIDYVVDYDNDTIGRLPGGDIPDGGQVDVRYVKGIPGDVVSSLKNAGSAVLPPVTAIVKKLAGPSDDMFTTGTDLSGVAVSVEISQSIGPDPDSVTVILNDATVYQEMDPQDEVIIAVAIGQVDSGCAEHYTECFRGLVRSREFVSNEEGAHQVRIKAEDFSVTIDAPYVGATGCTWHPKLRREVFRNGVIIADDYRTLKASGAYDSLEFDDVVEIHFSKEYPNAHAIMRECFGLAGSDHLTDIEIDCLDYPVTYLDGTEKTPGEVIRELASLAGASVQADGTTLVVSENGFPDGFKTSWVYDSVAILDESERDRSRESWTAVQIFGHSETSRIPTGSIYIPPTDFTQPGWCRVVDEEGTLEPSDSSRSDEYPQPAELTFQLDGELYDPSSVNVIGGELASRPEVTVVDGVKVINVTVLIDWNVDDKAGECPYVEDENNELLFRIHGRVFDAVPNAEGENLPIAQASVTREKLDGDDQGETFEITTDDDGYYFFEAVPLGEYRIIADAPGYLDNFEDEDPDNDEVRDLQQELDDYEEEIDKGRYEKRSTDYHVIVWARPVVESGPLSDLMVSQVLLEVRDEGTLSGEELVYGPTIRDGRITTEVLARRIGQVLLASEGSATQSITLTMPLNRWLKAGDGIRITGDAIDLTLPESREFQVTGVRKVINIGKGCAYDVVTSAPEKAGAFLIGKVETDPLDTHVGIVVAIYRNELGGRVYDVAADGQIMYGLKPYPLLGEIAIGEAVQVAKASRNAVSWMIVARTSDVFGKERICYV